MHREKYQFREKKYALVVWTVLILGLLGISFGGVRAYLFLSAQNQVTNTFSVDGHPEVTIGDGYSVAVRADYPVYLRAAVVLNWKTADDRLLAVVPSGYTLETQWIYHNGFYYYPEPVYSTDQDIPPVIDSLTAPGVGQAGYQAGCTLIADVAVQAVQAVGSTDSGDIPAVRDAWGVQPESLLPVQPPETP